MNLITSHRQNQKEETRLADRWPTLEPEPVFGDQYLFHV